MSKALSEYDDATWDRFFDFLSDTESLTDEQVSRQLREAGIDVRPAVERLREIVDAKKSPPGPIDP
jgi:hypothetical protein